MTGTLAHIFRHPIKAHGREALASVVLSAGAAMPWDRVWAVVHDAARLEPGWNSCVNFSRGAKAGQLMSVTAALDEATGRVTLDHPTAGPLTLRPDDPNDLASFLAWVAPLMPKDRAQPVGFYRHDTGLGDYADPYLSVLSLTSLAELGRQMGRDLSIHRWRANLWLDGAAPFAENDWIGRRLRVGPVEFEICERIVRCKATTVNPATGEVDADTLGALSQATGQQEFGVMARVITGGRIALADEWSLQ
jgi:uncharacterized protein